MRKIFTLAAAIALSVGTAGAQSYTFSTSSGVQPSNVGSVKITQVNSTTVRVLVDLLDGYGFMNSGQRSFLGFNLGAKEDNLSILSWVTPPSGSYTNNGTWQLSLSTTDVVYPGLSTFTVNILSNAGNGSSRALFGDIEFNLTRTGGLSIDDFVANAGGHYFGADLTNGQNTGGQVWGERGPRITSTVPEPSTYALVAAGLAGMFGIARRRRTMKA